MGSKARVRGIVDLDGRGFNVQVKKIKNSIRGVGAAASATKNLLAASFVGTGVRVAARLLRKVIDLGSEISDMAIRTSVGARELQVFEFAAREAGASTGNLDKALLKLKDSQGRVAAGEKLTIRLFKDLGIEEKKVLSIPIAELFQEVAKSLTAADNSGKEYSAVVQLMGRSAPKLTEAMNRLATEGFDVVAKAAEEAGQIMDEGLIQRLDSAADEIDRFERRWTIALGESLGSWRLFIKGVTGTDFAKNYLRNLIDPINAVKDLFSLPQQFAAAETAAIEKDAAKANAKQVAREATDERRREAANVARSRKGKAVRGAGPAVDALQKRGLIVGGGTEFAAEVALMKRQALASEATASNTAKIAAKIGKPKRIGQ